MSSKSNLGSTKDKFDKLLSQARDSVKAFDTLQKEGLNRAKNYIHIPTKEERKRFTDEKIVANLRKMGLATKEDIRELNDRIEELASELRGQISKMKKNEAKEHSAKNKDTSLS